jgi:murein DD-endopeptidase MepM/ murein hydrolase activator NlpD
MEDIVSRSRYPRKSSMVKKRRKTPRNGSLAQTIALQTIVCLVILLLVFIIKSIDNPVTNYDTNKVKYVLQLDYGIESIFKGMDSTIGGIREKLTGTGSEEEKSPVDVGGDSGVTDTSATLAKTANTLAAAPANSTGSTAGAMPETSVLSINTEDGGDLKVSMICPVDGTLSSPYGERIDPIDNSASFHEGVDIAAEEGSFVKAVLDGTVSDSGTSSSYGKYIVIRHDDGLTTVYAHCRELFVTKDQKVVQGDIIGSVGNTGNSTGAHLHLEIHRGGKVLNPLDYISVPLQ